MKGFALITVCALAAAACSTSDRKSDDTASAAAASATADPDRQAAGTGALPSGYSARTDRPDADMSGAKYATEGDEWVVTTGPAHIVYSPATMGNGNYTASASVEQLEKPTHPEAYGLFVGGRNLDTPSQAYTYFLVRGTGDLAIKVREGDATRDVIPWTPAADIPKENASGKSKYDLKVQVTNDAVKFSVNGKEVASVSKAGLPLDGIAGLRINHNLRVKVSPVSVTAP